MELQRERLYGSIAREKATQRADNLSTSVFALLNEPRDSRQKTWTWTGLALTAVAVCAICGTLATTTSLGYSPSRKHAPGHIGPDHTFVYIIGAPFTGTTALMGIFMTSPAVSDLCSAGVWACEDDKIFIAEGLLPKGTEVLEKHMSVKDWKYAIENVLAGFWDTNKRVLLDKSPNNLNKAREILEATKQVCPKCRVVFPVLTRNPRSKQDDDHSWWNEDNNKALLDTLNDPTLDTIRVHYESLATDVDDVVAGILKHIPELQSLDPRKEITKNWCQSSGNAGRCESVVAYFKENPLAWRSDFVLTEENKALLRRLGYDEPKGPAPAPETYKMNNTT